MLHGMASIFIIHIRKNFYSVRHGGLNFNEIHQVSLLRLHSVKKICVLYGALFVCNMHLVLLNVDIINNYCLQKVVFCLFLFVVYKH